MARETFHRESCQNLQHVTDTVTYWGKKRDIIQINICNIHGITFLILKMVKNKLTYIYGVQCKIISSYMGLTTSSPK